MSYDEPWYLTGWGLMLGFLLVLAMVAIPVALCIRSDIKEDEELGPGRVAAARGWAEVQKMKVVDVQCGRSANEGPGRPICHIYYKDAQEQIRRLRLLCVQGCLPIGEAQ